MNSPKQIDTKSKTQEQKPPKNHKTTKPKKQREPEFTPAEIEWMNTATDKEMFGA